MSSKLSTIKTPLTPLILMGALKKIQINPPLKIRGARGVMIFIFFFLYFSSAHAGIIIQHPNYTGLTNGLVGFWSFDGKDMSGTTALDRSGQGNNGTLTNGPIRTLGKIGQGMSFDGTDDYVRVTEQNDTLDIISTQSLTLSAWIKSLPAGANNPIIVQRFGSGGTPYYRLGLGLENCADGEAAIAVRGAGGGESYVCGINVGDNVWHHIIGIRDTGSAQLRIYVDGELKSSGTDSSSGDLATDSYLDIGTHLGAQYFNGSIDDVRIYNRALSADEIKRLYKIGGTLHVNTANLGNNDTLVKGLVGHWTFDGKDMNATQALDRSGQGNNGTLTNGPVRTLGKLGQALEFDGVNDYVDIPEISLASAITYSAWVKKDDISGQEGIFSNKGTLFEVADGGKLTWYSDVEISSVISNTSLSPNIWYHVAITQDSSNNYIFYLNGISDGSGSTNTLNNDTFSSDIGRYFSGRYTDGSIDDVRIYNRALSAAEVQRLYRSGTGVTLNYCNPQLKDARDGKTYDVVKIGKQCWMAENLNVGTREAGAGEQTNDAVVDKYCYDDSEANCTAEGGLYQWGELMAYNASCNGAGAYPYDKCIAPVQGICPAGWHIPSHYEWTTLERNAGSSPSSFPYDESTINYRGLDEGTNLKVGGPTGFEGILAGYRSTVGSFNLRGSYAYFWSSLESGASAWDRNLDSTEARVNRDAFNKADGFSVRCLKD